MLDLVVRSFLGQWGSAALDFYIANSLWINLVLVAYLILLIWSQRTYKLILAQIITNLLKEHGSQLAEKKPAALLKILAKSKFGWESLRKINQFPLIASPKSSWPRIKNEQTLQALFSPEKLANLMGKRTK